MDGGQLILIRAPARLLKASSHGVIFLAIIEISAHQQLREDSIPNRARFVVRILALITIPQAAKNT